MNGFEASLSLPTPCQLLASSALLSLPVWVKRDDLLHPVVSGNKYRKLKYPLLHIAASSRLAGHRPCLLTMGGIWSNHVHATAHAANAMGYQSQALIRGHAGMHSAMLDDCRALGMQIQYVDRSNYRSLRDNAAHRMNLIAPAGNQYWLPEGGSDPAALKGVAELIDELPLTPDVILVACGTAATLAGILAGLKGRSFVLGIAVLKNAGYLAGEVSRLHNIPYLLRIFSFIFNRIKIYNFFKYYFSQTH